MLYCYIPSNFYHFIYDFHCFKNLCFNINFSFFFSITTDTIIAIFISNPIFLLAEAIKAIGL